MILSHKHTSIFYSDVGQGKAILLLHGFLENSTMWRELIPKLSESNRIISVDLLGHGQTGCIGYIHTMEMMAEAVKSVLDELKIKDVVIIGHSMGGYVALALMELAPNLVKGVCLMNSTALSDTTEKKSNRERAIAFVKKNHKAFVNISISNLFAPSNKERLSKEIEHIKIEAQKMSLQGIVAALEGMKIRKDRTYLLREYTFKKMMVIGLRDPVLDYVTTIRHAKATHAKIIEFPDGHMSHLENTYDLTYNLLRFIEK